MIECLGYISACGAHTTRTTGLPGEATKSVTEVVKLVASGVFGDDSGPGE
jgi:hypothetical protein